MALIVSSLSPANPIRAIQRAARVLDGEARGPYDPFRIGRFEMWHEMDGTLRLHSDGEGGWFDPAEVEAVLARFVSEQL